METFVLRIWVPAAVEGESCDGPCSTLHGMIQHIGSDRALPFRTTDELVALVREALTDTRHHDELPSSLSSAEAGRAGDNAAPPPGPQPDASQATHVKL